MNRDIFIRNITKDRIEMSPKGRNANELSVEEFEKNYENFFDMIFEIAATDISSLTGYGEFDENNIAPYNTVKEFIIDTFNEEKEGYWHNWRQMFETSYLKKDYFEKIYAKALEYAPYCEGQRYLANNNTFFCNMVRDFIDVFDWSPIEVPLLKAELYREANEMGKCREVLDAISYEKLEDFEKGIYDGIKERMEQNDTVVFRLYV
jgi:hypothetical protein